MNPSIGEPVSALGWALVHFLWQGALLGLLAAGLLALLRGARPQARYLVACAALLACVLLPLAGVLRAAGGDGTAPVAITTAPVAEAAAVPTIAALPTFGHLVDGSRLRDRVQPRLPLIVALWSLGAALLALRMCAGLAWVARAGGEGRGRENGPWQARLDALAARMALPRQVLLRVVDGLDGPAAARWLRPVVLVPAALLARMPAELIEALLAHELAHVRRHDYLVNLAQGAIEALLFYHPVVWWLSRQVRIERELIADDLAAQALGDPRPLALALDALARLQHEGIASPDPTPTLALAADGANLMSRIQRLVRPQRASSGWKAAVPVIGISLLCLSFAQAEPAAPEQASVVQAVLDTPAPTATATHDEPGMEVHGRLTIDSDDRDSDGYVLLGDGDGLTYMSGNLDDLERLRAMRDDGEAGFLWVRRDGREYLSRDPQLLASVRQAWASTEPVSRRMDALGEEMEKHGEVMERLGERMEAQSGLGEADAAAMERLGERMSALGERQAELAGETIRLANAAADAGDARDRDLANRRLRELESTRERLGEEMDQLGELMDKHGEAMERIHAPMEALGEEMERAGKPMEALGERMEVLGEEMERLSEVAERQTRAAIDRAIRDGRLAPMQSRASR